VDVLPNTWCIDPALVERALTARTKAVIPVHLYGLPADIEAIESICKPRGIAIVEDAAEAIGGRILGRRVGSLGDVAAFSFYGNKTITTGEGGMVTTNDPELAKRIRHLKDHGMSPVRRYYHQELAFNYRMTNIQAALGVAQMTRIDDLVRRKRAIYEAYRSAFMHRSEVQLNPTAPGKTNALWMSCLLLDDDWPVSRDAFADELCRRGIDTRPFFIPMSALPHLTQYRRVGAGSAERSHAYQLSHRGLNLPSGCNLTDQDLDCIAEQVLGAMDALNHRKVFAATQSLRDELTGTWRVSAE
jgi:perosamine synthetase